MSESLYARNPIDRDKFTGTIKERRGLVETPRGILGKSGQARNPAWVKLSGICGSCNPKAANITLPVSETTWAQTYGGGNFKPSPILQRVVLDYGGDWALAQKLSATIQCFNEKDFKSVVETFLLPGNKISVQFGYNTANQVWHSKSQGKTLKGFRTATFGFTTGEHGSWICNFTAVSSATAMKSIDMLNIVGDGTLKYDIAGEHDSTDIMAVRSIMELIASDAQRNGMDSLDVLKDGQVFTEKDLTNYSPGPVKFKDAAMALFTSDHIIKLPERAASAISKWVGLTDADQVDGKYQIYVTLGYVVNRIVNDQLLKTILRGIGKKDKSDFEKLKIEFSKDYSYATFPTPIRSGDPLSVLLLGQRRGNYKSTTSNVGKDFEEKLTNPAAVTCSNGNIIDLKKILIHKDVVKAALTASTKVDVATADQTGVKDTKDEVISLADFFKKLFDMIGDATGGTLALRLVEDVEDEDKNTFIIVDQNSGGKTKIDCLLLNPIDGDGSTRTCDIQSNVGSEEYKASMFIGNSRKGDPSTVMRQCMPDLDNARETSWKEALVAFKELVYDPGVLGKSDFDGKHISSLKSTMSTLFRNRPQPVESETIHWPGMQMTATLDGIWGLVPGCAISTTQLLKEWRDAGLYFRVSTVTHTFEESDWSTTVEGLMSYSKNLTMV